MSYGIGKPTTKTGLRRNAVAALLALALVSGSFAVAQHATAAGDYRFSINDVTVTEGSPAVFIVTVTPPPNTGDTVSVQACTSDGSATAPADYTANPPPVQLPPAPGGCPAVTTLTFVHAGPSTQNFNVTTINDSTPEPTENFNANLKNPMITCGAPECSVGITDNAGTGTILDNDPGLSINDVSLPEGNSGVTLFAFTVTSTQPAAAGCPITVPYSTSDGTANSGTDYAPASGTVTIPAGSTTSGPITVQVFGDAVTEPDETFNVNLGTPTVPSTAIPQCSAPPRVVKGTGVGTIQNDDGGVPPPPPGPPTTSALTISDGKPEKATTKSDCKFVIAINPPSQNAVTVNFATSGAEDQITPSNGTLTFAPGATGTEITVDVIKKRRKKATFDVLLSNANGATIADGTGTCTIKKKKKKKR